MDFMSDRSSIKTKSSGQVAKRKSIWFKLGCVFFATIVILLITAVIIIKSLVSEDYLADKLEGSINSHVEIGAVELALFSVPTRFTLSDVTLSPRDRDPSSAGIKVEQLDLNVNFWKLFNKHIDVSKITIKGAEISMISFEDGSTSLEKMLRSPEEEDNTSESISGPKRDNYVSLESNEGGSNEGGSNEGGSNEGGFNAFDQEDFIASLGGLVIEDSHVDITLEKTGLRIRCSDVQLVLSSISVDTKNLKATNTAKLTMASKIEIHSTEGWHYGDLNLTGDASAMIFNPETGNMEPEVRGRIDLGDASWLNTKVPVISDAWESLEILEKVGVSITRLPERATFGRSQAVAVHYHLGKITVHEPLSIWLGDWEIAALDGSWLQTETDQHEINAEMLASVKSSERFLKAMSAVVGLLPSKMADKLINDVKGKIYKNNRLFIKVRSSEDLSDPKVRVVEGVPDLLDEAKKSGEDALKQKAGDLLRGLFR